MKLLEILSYEFKENEYELKVLEHNMNNKSNSKNDAYIQKMGEKCPLISFYVLNPFFNIQFKLLYLQEYFNNLIIYNIG